MWKVSSISRTSGRPTRSISSSPWRVVHRMSVSNRFSGSTASTTP